MPTTMAEREQKTPASEDAAAKDELRAAMREVLAAQRRLRGRDAQRRGDGLTFPQYQLLTALAEDDLTISELAAHAELSPASATTMVDGLEASGCVERVRSDTDRRKVSVRLTGEGRRRRDVRDAEIGVAFDGVLAGLSEGEIRRTARVIRRMAKLFDAL